MLKENKSENTKLIHSTVEYLEALGHVDIRADLEGYETPKSYTLKQEETKLQPDVVSMSPTGAICYTEVAVKTDKVSLLKSKWHFLRMMSEMKNGTFQVVAHKGNYSVASKLAKEIDSSVNVIRI